MTHVTAKTKLNQKEIKVICKKLVTYTISFLAGDMCVAKSSKDGQYCNATVTSIDGDNATVKFDDGSRGDEHVRIRALLISGVSRRPVSAKTPDQRPRLLTQVNWHKSGRP
jgi:hypothetical protein